MVCIHVVRVCDLRGGEEDINSFSHVSPFFLNQQITRQKLFTSKQEDLMLVSYVAGLLLLHVSVDVLISVIRAIGRDFFILIFLLFNRKRE